MSVVLVTGSSSGFGLLTVCELARRGHSVFASMRDPRRDGPLRTALGAAGVSAEVVALDITDDGSVAAAVAAVIDQAGRIDVLVNNAGIGYVGPLEELPEAHLAEMFATNVFGTVRVTREVLALMRENGSGHIVNVTSLAAFVSAPFMGAYAATKHALDALGEALAVEVAPFGIHVTNVAPGAYLTPMVDGVAGALAQAEGSAYSDRFRTVIKRHAASMRANDTPQDVADAIADAIEAEPPPARVVVPSASAFIAEGRGTTPPEQMRALIGGSYGV